MSKILVVSLVVVASLCSASTSTEIDKVHTALDNLAAYAESYLQGRCTSLTGDCGGQCSVAGCSSTFSSTQGYECRSDFGTATCNGQCETRSIESSALRMPLATDFASADAQAFTCASRKLDTQFKEEFSAGNLKGWQYVADGNTGITRLYPGAPQGRSSGTCEDYDARLRPWYTAASSGPKDVVLLIDASTSMQNCNSVTTGACAQSRWEVVKKAVKSIFGTLTPNDFVATVTFSVGAKVLNSETGLIRADTDTSTTTWVNYQKKFETVLLESATNMAPGFTKAFELLKDSTSDTSGCSKIILFLTDGDSTDVSGNLTASKETIQSAIAAGQASLLAATGKNAHIFSYSMGTNTDTTIPKAVACDNKGVWAPIPSGIDPIVAMKAYYQFLSSSISTKAIRWTAPYEDAFGLGTVVTAARPIYDYTKAVPVQVGVIATDILTSTLGGTSAAVVNALIGAGNGCPNLSNLSTCQLQNLRNASGYECPNEVTSASCYTGNDLVTLSSCTALSSLNKILCTDVSATTLLESPSKDNSAVLCASSGSSSTVEEDQTGLIVGVVIGVLVGLALIGGIIAYMVMSPSKPKDTPAARRETPPPAANNNPVSNAVQGAAAGVATGAAAAGNAIQGAAANIYPQAPPQQPQQQQQYPTYPQQPHQTGQPAYPAYPAAPAAPAYPAPPPNNTYPTGTPPPAYSNDSA